MPRPTPDREFDSVQLQDLIGRVRAGDRAAEDALVRAILGRIQKLSRRMLNQFPDLRYAEQTADVVQDSLVRLLRALKTVTPPTTRDFFNLAAEQIRRQLLDLARHHRRGPTVPLRPTGDSSGDGPAPADPAPRHDDLDLWAQFHAAVEDLPPEQREVIGLTYYHGWTQAQIAALFQVDERTIRRRWQAACLNLNKIVGGRLPGA
jgi:RNA polymerase sigma factor (sigma-70 family)